MDSPLEGIKVLDWTIWQQGPVCSSMLGDLGADVIKIEERTGGDIGRGIMRMIGVQMGVGGRNFYFEYNNRNKRGITVDLRKEEGKQIIYKLVEQSDVFVQNFRKGVAERLGLDYETLLKYNPKLIYAHGTGWGPKGPEAELPSMDFTGLGKTGLMLVGGEPGAPPVNFQPGLADQMGAIFLAYGVLAALLVREKTGEGQRVDASLLGGTVCGLEGLNFAAKTVMGQELPRPTRAKAGNALWNYYKCKDGNWIILCMAASDRYWPAFCSRMGTPELEKDPRFEDMEKRSENCVELVAILDKAFEAKDRDEWIAILREEKDFMVGPVNSLSDLV
ncbi:MAG: CoA transferase, partial [Chloroflexota bacterium]|nr:CoA transferase [Chloroflexota bacterium]